MHCPPTLFTKTETRKRTQKANYSCNATPILKRTLTKQGEESLHVIALESFWKVTEFWMQRFSQEKNSSFTLLCFKKFFFGMTNYHHIPVYSINNSLNIPRWIPVLRCTERKGYKFKTDNSKCIAPNYLLTINVFLKLLDSRLERKWN